MIEAKGITKYYGNFKALEGVSFTVARGEILGFLGPNGAGKSTTMKVLTTFLSASEGTASVDGFDVHANPLEVRRRLGYLPETPPLYGDMSVEEYLKFSGRARGLGGGVLKQQVARVVEITGLAPKFKNVVNELSKGYRQRVGIAQALIHDPPALILDEPTSGLDPNQIIEIRKLIADLRRSNKAVIFSTHILQEAAAVADRLVIINNGRKVADGTPDELASRAADRLSVRVLVRGSSPYLHDALAGLGAVTEVRPKDAPEGYTRLELMIKGGEPALRETCEAVSRTATKLGLTLSELSPQSLTLEDVFLRLLNEGKPAAVEKQAPPALEDKEEDNENLKSTNAGTRMTPRPLENDANDAEEPFGVKSPTETAISSGSIGNVAADGADEAPANREGA